ncbi:MAG: hypothetical protein JJE34_00305 [Alphaproteobacteria bacterium]|nr:hypothetical protein [Alphaproteobacteria bacterium]
MSNTTAASALVALLISFAALIISILAHKLNGQGHKLRVQDFKLNLLQERRECVNRMREIDAAFLRDGRIDDDHWRKLVQLLNDAELLYQDELIEDIRKLLDGVVKSSIYSNRAQVYFQRNNDKKGQEFLEKQFNSDDETIDALQGLKDKLVEATRVREVK